MRFSLSLVIGCVLLPVTLASRTMGGELLLVTEQTNLYRMENGKRKAERLLKINTVLEVLTPEGAEKAFEKETFKKVLVITRNVEGWVDTTYCGDFAEEAKKRNIIPTTVEWDRYLFLSKDIRYKVPAIIIHYGNRELLQNWVSLHKILDKQRKENRVTPFVYLARAEIWRKLDNYEEALSDYLRVAKLIEGEKNLTKRAEYFLLLQKALDALDRTPRERQYLEARDYYGEGFHAFWSGDYKGALANFNDAVHLAPREPLYRYYRALVFKKLNKEVLAFHDSRMGSYLEHNKKNERFRIHSQQFLDHALERLQGPTRFWLTKLRRGKYKPRPDPYQ